MNQTASRLFAHSWQSNSARRLSGDDDQIISDISLGHALVDSMTSTGRPAEPTDGEALSAASAQIRSFSKRLLLLTPFKPHEDLGVTLQDWEGCVYQVGETSFSARLVDRTKGGECDTEIAEIPNDEVDDGDADLLRPGAIFYLTVRRRILPGGRHEVGSRIIFRRMPAWGRTALANAEAEAKNLASYFADE
jgi:hypothetical protein